MEAETLVALLSPLLPMLPLLLFVSGQGWAADPLLPSASAAGAGSVGHHLFPVSLTARAWGGSERHTTQDRGAG
jgi:hypothetical protein